MFEPLKISPLRKNVTGANHFDRLHSNFENPPKDQVLDGSSIQTYRNTDSVPIDQIMRMSDNDSIQMQPLKEEDVLMQPKLRMQPMEEKEEFIQPKSSAQQRMDIATENIQHEINNTKGTGIQMDKQTQSFMGNRFETDFNNINIHTDSSSVQLNKQLNARAFTVGNDIYFNEGEYKPNSNNGKHLLAHELTHTMQQNGQIQNMVQCDRTGDRETEREEERGRRRRDTPGGRDRGRGLGGDLDSDWAGRAILGRWLTGSGDWNIINNPTWTAYMMNSAVLREQLTEKLHEVVNEGISIADTLHQDHFAISETFAAAVENGEGIIGYQYLHGTNADVGGFAIWGEGRILNLPDGQRIVILNLHYQWNDMIDPNPQYQTDSIKSILGEIITLGQAESYEIHISWPGVSTAIIDSSNNIVTSAGYPFY